MKKLLAIIMCLMALASCADMNNPAGNTQTPSANSNSSQSIRTMIVPTDKNPIGSDWTVLGEVGYIIDEEYCDIILATDADRDADGNMVWDDSQNWALVVVGESRNFVLFDSRLSGKAYINVTTKDNLPQITLVCDTPAGISATGYIYSEDAFYQEELITPENNGNNIYSTFPEYN